MTNVITIMDGSSVCYIPLDAIEYIRSGADTTGVSRIWLFFKSGRSMTLNGSVSDVNDALESALRREERFNEVLRVMENAP